VLPPLANTLAYSERSDSDEEKKVFLTLKPEFRLSGHISSSSSFASSFST
jgi:hypothetical protein